MGSDTPRCPLTKVWCCPYPRATQISSGVNGFGFHRVFALALSKMECRSLPRDQHPLNSLSHAEAGETFTPP